MKAETGNLKLVAAGLAALLAVTGPCLAGRETVAENTAQPQGPQSISVIFREFRGRNSEEEASTENTEKHGRICDMAVEKSSLAETISTHGSTAAPSSPVLTPDTALAFAWTNHPKMKAAQAMIEAAHGSRVQAGLWPKPELGLSHMSKVEVKSEDGVSIAQRFELGGKRNARISMADAEAFAKQAELLDRWLGVRADVKEALSRLAYARETLSLAEQKAKADSENEELTRNLEKAGKVSALESIDAQQKAGMSKALEVSAAARAANAEREVFFALGMQPPDGPRTVECPTNTDVALPDTGALLALAATNSPAARTARARRLVSEARERMAATARWPDLTLGAQYSRMTMNDGGSGNGSAVMASLDLPIFNRGQGDRLQAEQERVAAEAGQDEAAFDTGKRVSELLSDFKQKLVDHEYLSRTAVPLAQKKHALNEDSFRKGRLSRRACLQSLGELLDLRAKCAEARLMLDTAAAEIERLTLVVTEPPQR